MWTSIEIAKLIASVLTPIAVAVLGLWLNRRLKRIEHFQWANQKAIEKRLEVYTALAPLLNDLYCYFDYIGEWKMKAPSEVIGLKRSIDRLFYVNAPIFSDYFREVYREFMNLYFIPGPLTDYTASARLKTDVKIRMDMFKAVGQKWDSNWDIFFVSTEHVSSRDEIVKGYGRLMDAFAKELGVGLDEGK